MATTDARPGFKLPWSADRTEPDAPDAAPAARESEQASSAAPGSTLDRAAQSVGGSDATTETTPEPAPTAVSAPTPGATPTDPWRLSAQPVVAVEPPRRKPNKLMADLTRAMQSAAETARSETLERLQLDAKAFVESVHARSGTEADALRRTADEDIAGIREWSKAEIARIREETDQRIAGRKAGLDEEIKAHAARIEAQIERVQQHVAWFENEMAGFFERLLAEDDPTRLAAMAENLPEPPSFEDEPAALAAPTAPPTDLAAAAVEAPEASDPEAAFSAIQAAAEAADEIEHAEVSGAEPDAEPAAEVDIADSAEVVAADAGDATQAPAGHGVPTGDGRAAGTDPRLTVLGLSPQAAADAEAEAELDGTGDVEEIEGISDEALSARLAGLVPVDGVAPSSELRSTRVIVTGLVSVASIAGFKRHLGRFEGVTSVGVSSGPEGEFIFGVVHAPGLDLPDAVRGLPGFAARITDTTDDTVTVAARDPETAS